MGSRVQCARDPAEVGVFCVFASGFRLFLRVREGGGSEGGIPTGQDARKRDEKLRRCPVRESRGKTTFDDWRKGGDSYRGSSSRNPPRNRPLPVRPFRGPAAVSGRQ